MDERDVSDSDGNPYTAYFQELLAYPGLQVVDQRCVGRIKKLTEDAGATLDDDKIADLLSKFPVGKRPDVLFMTRRSLKQLQQSRTATNATGAPAPFPTESHGVPIVVDAQSLKYLDGTQVDYAREGLNEGFQFDNPNVSATCGCGESFSL